MAKTSAERQAEYRAKRAGESGSERRLSTWVSTKTDLTLEKLAERYGITKKAVIELLVLNEDQKIKRLTAKAVVQPHAGSVRDSEKLRGNDSRDIDAKKKLKAPDNKKLPPNSIESTFTRSLGAQFGFEF